MFMLCLLRPAAPCCALLLCCRLLRTARTQRYARPVHRSSSPLNACSDEGTFELSLAAESLHEALLRDAGAAILSDLYIRR